MNNGIICGNYKPKQISKVYQLPFRFKFKFKFEFEFCCSKQKPLGLWLGSYVNKIEVLNRQYDSVVLKVEMFMLSSESEHLIL